MFVSSDNCDGAVVPAAMCSRQSSPPKAIVDASPLQPAMDRNKECKSGRCGALSSRFREFAGITVTYSYNEHLGRILIRSRVRRIIVEVIRSSSSGAVLAALIR